MKKAVFATLVLLFVTGCTSYRQPTPERQAIKDACNGGDFSACADLGHIVQQERMKTAS